MYRYRMFKDKLNHLKKCGKITQIFLSEKSDPDQVQWVRIRIHNTDNLMNYPFIGIFSVGVILYFLTPV